MHILQMQETQMEDMEMQTQAQNQGYVERLYGVFMDTMLEQLQERGVVELSRPVSEIDAAEVEELVARHYKRVRDRWVAQDIWDAASQAAWDDAQSLVNLDVLGREEARRLLVEVNNRVCALLGLMDRRQELAPPEEIQQAAQEMMALYTEYLARELRCAPEALPQKAETLTQCGYYDLDDLREAQQMAQGMAYHTLTNRRHDLMALHGDEVEEQFLSLRQQAGY